MLRRPFPCSKTYTGLLLLLLTSRFGGFSGAISTCIKTDDSSNRVSVFESKGDTARPIYNLPTVNEESNPSSSAMRLRVWPGHKFPRPSILTSPSAEKLHGQCSRLCGDMPFFGLGPIKWSNFM